MNKLKKARKGQERKKRASREAAKKNGRANIFEGIAIAFAAMFMLLSLMGMATGEIGRWTRLLLGGIFSSFSIAVPLLLIWISAGKLSSNIESIKFTRYRLHYVFFAGCLLLYCVVNAAALQASISGMGDIKRAFVAGESMQGCGLAGLLVSASIVRLIGSDGSMLMGISLLLFSVAFGFDVPLLKKTAQLLKGVISFALKSTKAAFTAAQKRKKKVPVRKKEAKPSEEFEIVDFKITNSPQDNRASLEAVENISVQGKESAEAAEAPPKEAKDGLNVSEEQSQICYCNYNIPPVTMLSRNESISSSGDKMEIKDTVKMLEKTLLDFGVDAKVSQVSIGPAITRYEIQPKSGVKVSKIVNLSDDIALNLAAQSIRIEAPIPGKSAVGIEVPNKSRESVHLRDIVESGAFKAAKSKLSFAIGKDISGAPVVADIAKMPHMLIAGATGAGKSVCVNSLIMSILLNARPDEVKFIMIDPKVVELSGYNGIPHLLIPVVTDTKKAAMALNWAVSEMTRRYGVFAENNARDIEGYNQKADEKLPQIIVIIDELADLMMASPKEVEDSICRLAQMARAAGMHLVIATQRPSVDVITGLIKANIPSRIAFAVSSSTDSRTIIDSGGAEKLLGRGDMLFYPVGQSKPTRVQGAFVDEGEIKSVVEFVKDQEFKQESESGGISQEIESMATAEEEFEDELMSEAIELVISSNQASASMLQRRLRVGFNRAARMIEEMEKKGIIGPSEGSKPRRVLRSRED
ncbi:FtsK/SpoIIIE family DNA translocase [Peptoclostridium acidaminophilum]|uniref:FtsK/SpoIIIE family DNA translocase n=1 Tax=Peptoclostridium acidaminophilum TaxID=1731 RepID=UPI001FA6B1C9|nr:DNA translocase FtsK [Peptoclostridium acidaminophilum]